MDAISKEEFEFRRDVLERMTRIETILIPLANGRVQAIETDVDKIKEGRAWDRGVAAGISIAVSTAIALARTLLRHP